VGPSPHDAAAALRGGADADAALVDTVRNGPATLAEVAAWALGERHQEADEPDAAIISALSDATLHHDDPLVREAAVAALGAIGEPGAKDAVLAALSDRATVRRRAVIALAAFDGDDVDAALDRARSDRDWQVRQAAEDLTDPRA
jgi:HEAT repeat protein